MSADADAELWDVQHTHLNLPITAIAFEADDGERPIIVVNDAQPHSFVIEAIRALKERHGKLLLMPLQLFADLARRLFADGPTAATTISAVITGTGITLAFAPHYVPPQVFAAPPHSHHHNMPTLEAVSRPTLRVVRHPSPRATPSLRPRTPEPRPTKTPHAAATSKAASTTTSPSASPVDAPSAPRTRAPDSRPSPTSSPPTATATDSPIAVPQPTETLTLLDVDLSLPKVKVKIKM